MRKKREKEFQSTYAAVPMKIWNPFALVQKPRASDKRHEKTAININFTLQSWIILKTRIEVAGMSVAIKLLVMIAMK